MSKRASIGLLCGLGAITAAWAQPAMPVVQMPHIVMPQVKAPVPNARVMPVPGQLDGSTLSAVAMFPPPGEAGKAQVSGAVTPDPGYEAALKQAFAARDDRAARADALAKSASAASTRLDAMRERLHNAPQSDLAQNAIRQGQALANAMRPKTAAPLSDAEKAANAKRQSLMTPSGRDGYCRELAQPSGGPVSAGVVCACGLQYQALILRQVHAIRDANEKFTKDHHLDSAGLAPTPARLAEEKDFSRMCAAVAYRESDPRRRLLPSDNSYAVDGERDKDAKATVFRALHDQIGELMEMPRYFADLRVKYAGAVGRDKSRQDKYMKTVFDLRDKYLRLFRNNAQQAKKNASQRDAYWAAVPVGQQITRQAEAEYAPLCNGELAALEGNITSADNLLADAVDEYKDSRQKQFTAFKTELPALESLARRNGDDSWFAAYLNRFAAADTLDWANADVEIQMGYRIGMESPLYFVGDAEQDPKGAFQGQVCGGQFSKLLDFTRNAAQHSRTRFDYGKAGTLITYHPGGDLSEHSEGMVLGFYLELHGSPEKKQQVALTRQAAMMDAQGGRYPQDGP